MKLLGVIFQHLDSILYGSVQGEYVCSSSCMIWFWMSHFVIHCMLQSKRALFSDIHDWQQFLVALIELSGP